MSFPFLAVAPVVWSIATIAWLLAGLYVYVALVRQISIRAVAAGETTPKRFGLPELLQANRVHSSGVL